MRKLVGWGTAALVAVAVVVGVLGAALSWDWGDIPTWVQSVATVAALGAAGVGAFFAYRQLGALREQVRLQDEALKLQMEQLRADRIEAERRSEQELNLRKIEARRQAEQIEVMPKLRSVIHAEAPHNDMLALRIDNTSSRPIWDVGARLDMKPFSRKPYAQCEGSYEASATPMGRAALPPLRLIRRGESVALIFPVQERHFPNAREPHPSHGVWFLNPDGSLPDQVHPGDLLTPPVIGYVIRFTDDAGNHWELTDDMSLTQISDRSDW